MVSGTDSSEAEFYRSEVPLAELGEEHDFYREVVTRLLGKPYDLELDGCDLKNHPRHDLPAESYTQTIFQYHATKPNLPGFTFRCELKVRQFRFKQELEIEPSFSSLHCLNERIPMRKIDVAQIVRRHLPRLYILALLDLSNQMFTLDD